MTIKKSNLYAYYVRHHDAIKVGFGDSSVQRMRAYAKQYELDVELSSLRTWDIPVSGIAPHVESYCHSALVDAGYEILYLLKNDQEAQELFKLYKRPYEEALLIVAGAIEEAVSEIYARLSKINPLTEEKLRQKKIRNKLRIETQQQIRTQEHEKRVSECADHIRAMWPIHYQNLLDDFESSRKINKNFSYQESSIKTFFTGEKDPVSRMYEWESYSLIRGYVEKIFFHMRDAKQGYIKTALAFRDGQVIADAAIACDCSLINPGGRGLNFINYAIDREDVAFLEVRLAVQEATYCFGGDDASDLIKRDPVLQHLVETARKFPPPELNSDFQAYLVNSRQRT